MGKTFCAITRFETTGLRTDLVAALKGIDDTASAAGLPLPATPTISFVEPGGNDATALRGRFDHPFLTIAAAIAAALTGDAIQIAPGTYVENVVIPGTKSLALIGTPGRSKIVPGSGVSVSLTTTVATRTVLLQGLVLSKGVTADTAINTNLSLDEVDCGSTGVVLCTGLKSLRLNSVSASSITVTDCGAVEIFDSSFLHPSTFEFDMATSVVARDVYRIGGSNFDNVRIHGHPSIYIEPECITNGVTGDPLTVFKDLVFDYAPDITLRHRAGSVSVAFPTTEMGGAENVLSCNGGDFDDLTVSCTDAGQPAIVEARGLSLRVDGSSFDGDIAADARGIGGSWTATGNATVDRDFYSVSAANSGGVQAGVIAPPFPASAVSLLEATASPDTLATGVVALPGPITASSVPFETTVATGGNVIIHVHRRAGV